MKDVGPNAESPVWQYILDIVRYTSNTANQFITYPLDNRKILLIFMLVSLSFDVRSFRRAVWCLCLCPLYSCAAFIRCLITWNVVGIPMCICLCFHLIKIMMNRITVFVRFLETCYCVVRLSTLRLASLNRTEGDYHQFHHSADFSFNFADVTQSHSSLFRLFYDTTSTAEVFICETNVICDVNCVRKAVVTYCSAIGCIYIKDLLNIWRIFRKIVG